MASYMDKKKQQSKLKILMDLGPAAPGSFDKDEEGKEIAKKKKKPKKKPKKGTGEDEDDMEIADAVPMA